MFLVMVDKCFVIIMPTDTRIQKKNPKNRDMMSFHSYTVADSVVAVGNNVSEC